MREALAKAGLCVEWPETVRDDEDLCIEAVYHTGVNGYEKLVNIDLRGFDLLRKGTINSDVDAAVAGALWSAWYSYDIDDELKLNLEAKGAPGAVDLLEDLKEADRMLGYFAEVSEAVSYGGEPPDAADDKEIYIIGKDARALCGMLARIADKKVPFKWSKEEKAFAKSLRRQLINSLKEN